MVLVLPVEQVSLVVRLIDHRLVQLRRAHAATEIPEQEELSEAVELTQLFMTVQEQFREARETRFRQCCKNAFS